MDKMLTEYNILRISDDKDLVSDVELLKSYIKKHDSLVSGRFKILGDAYACRPSILDYTKNPKKTAEHKPDHRVSANFPRYIVDTYCGFSRGIPVSVSVAADNNGTEDRGELAEFVRELIEANDLDDVNTELHRLKCIFGESYQLAYVDEMGEVETVAVSPIDSFPVYDNSIKPRLRYFVRTYTDEDNKTHGTISDETYVYYFDMSDGEIVFTDSRPHGFGSVPVVIYTMNSDRIGLIEVVLSLADKYDKTLSEKMNDVDSFADAILSIRGATLSRDQVADLRDRRIINIGGPDGANSAVEFLARPSGDATQENFLERVERLIFTVSMVCNVADDNFATSSGIALKMKMQPMANLATGDWRRDQASMKMFWRLVCANPVTSLQPDDWKLLKFQNDLNYPDNSTDAADLATKLDGVISHRTQLEILPASIVSDVDEELKRIEEETETETEKTETETETETEDEQTETETGEKPAEVEEEQSEE